MIEQAAYRDRLSGAKGGEICDGYDLAYEAWGDACEAPNSGLLAFAYLWRRFGPPTQGGDDHKSLVDYTLTTRDPDVFLWLTCSGSRLRLGVGYLVTDAIQEAIAQPYRDWEEACQHWWLKRHPEWIGKEQTEECGTAYYKFRMPFGGSNDRSELDEAEKEIGEYPRPRGHWRENGPLYVRVNEALLDAMRDLLRPVFIRDVPINIFGRCQEHDDAVEPSKYAGLGIDTKPLDALLA